MLIGLSLGLVWFSPKQIICLSIPFKLLAMLWFASHWVCVFGFIHPTSISLCSSYFPNAHSLPSTLPLFCFPTQQFLQLSITDIRFSVNPILSHSSFHSNVSIKPKISHVCKNVHWLSIVLTIHLFWLLHLVLLRLSTRPLRLPLNSILPYNSHCFIN